MLGEHATAIPRAGASRADCAAASLPGASRAGGQAVAGWLAKRPRPGRLVALRLGFLGTPRPAAVVLAALVGAGHEVPLVVTRADKRRGRGSQSAPSPVKETAQVLGIPVSHRDADLLAAGVDLGVVVAYGRLIKPPLLGGIELVNLHFSLLPRWRGAAPVERAILAGDEETGVSLMRVEAGLDTGPVYRRQAVRIQAEETAGQLRARLAELGAGMLVEALAQGLGHPEEQSGEATYAEKVSSSELRLDWELPAEVLTRMVRLERAWTTWRGKRLLVLAAALAGGTWSGVPGTLIGEVVVAGKQAGGEQAGGEPAGDATGGHSGLRLVLVQPEGRRAIPAAEWLRGARPRPGERLGE